MTGGIRLAVEPTEPFQKRGSRRNKVVSGMVASVRSSKERVVGTYLLPEEEGSVSHAR